MNPANSPKLRLLALFLLYSSLIHQMSAQTSVADSLPADDEIIVLSPFEVTTSDDVGYLAQNTLAGSRLNTELKNTAAAISVLTTEFLKDIGATNMRDLILFQNNAVPEVGDSAQNINGNPVVGNQEWQLRIRGLAASYARNYFDWGVPTDFYNLDRIEQSRGPNSILFGFGAAGGIVNSMTKQARTTKNFGEVGFAFGSWDRKRGTFDTNLVLIDDKLAMRLNAVAEDSDSWRLFEFSKSRRVDLAARYNFSENASLKAEFETGNIKDNVTRPWLAIDQTVQWRAAGSPIEWPAGWVVTYATWTPHYVYIDNDQSTADWQGAPFSYSSGASGLWGHIPTDGSWDSIIPRNSNLAGPDATRETDYTTYSVFYQNQISRAASIEVAFNHQDYTFTGYDANASGMNAPYAFLGGATELWGDASYYHPGNWAVNPFAGRMYLENNWTKRNQTADIDQVRGTFAYDLDLGNLGRHRFAGMYEHAWRDFLNEEFAEVFLGSPFDSRAEWDTNRVFRRHYFTPGEAADIHAASWKDPVNLTNPNTGQPLATGWVIGQDPVRNSTQDQDTVLAAIQSQFLNDKLVTILGYRYDFLRYRTAPTVRGSDGQLVLDQNAEFSTDFKASTLSAGAVYHLSEKISAYANHSTSRSLPNVNQRIIGYGLPPMSEGTGSDIGLKFDLFGGRVYATLGYYKTDISKSTEWGNIKTSVTDLNTRILGKLVADNLLSASEAAGRMIDANAYLQDRNADGWELTFIANPNPNWRISANFAINNVVNDNIMSEVRAWVDENAAFWLQKAASAGGADYLLGGGDWDTLGNNIGWTNDYIESQRAFNGQEAKGERTYGANLYTSYRFHSGALDGFWIGGGGRYQSANPVGVIDGKIIKGNELALFDASCGYGFKPKAGNGKYSVDIQLNVSNVFDSDRIQIYSISDWWTPPSTVPAKLGMQEPRRFTVTTTIGF